MHGLLNDHWRRVDRDRSRAAAAVAAFGAAMSGGGAASDQQASGGEKGEASQTHGEHLVKKKQQ